MKNFGGIDDKLADRDKASVLLQPIPYDGTSTWGKGADKGFDAFIEASENMELYDIETDSEVYKKGIHTLDPVNEKSSPEAVFKAVLSKTKDLLSEKKFLTFFGGEHSISIGVIEAFRQKYPNLSVLQLDAHSDLRKSYDGSEYNHACALHKASLQTNLVQVGIRSMDISEKKFMDPGKCFFAEDMCNDTSWMENSVKLLGEDVYLTIDLDVLDPSIMPATGTPEPGGMDWNTTIRYLKKVFREKNVVGFDIVEFAPLENLRSPGFLVAKLYYKMLSYKFT
ncbi:MAG: agmatinase [Bacteroidota bacterium]